MMQPRWFISTLTLVLLPWSVFAAEVPSSPGPFDTAKLDGLLKTIISSITGTPGRWEGVFDGAPVLVMSHDGHNRMRVLAPVARLEALDAAILLRLLEANFSAALDARYALFRGMLWSVFLQPLDSLTEPELRNALQQVVTLVKRTGTTYSSTDLSLGRYPPNPEDSRGLQPQDNPLRPQPR
ncbi:MAG: type III secretion system chaperone [Candidatus Entotheonellia bacterium]